MKLVYPYETEINTPEEAVSYILNINAIIVHDTLQTGVAADMSLTNALTSANKYTNTSKKTIQINSEWSFFLLKITDNKFSISHSDIHDWKLLFTICKNRNRQ